MEEKPPIVFANKGKAFRDLFIVFLPMLALIIFLPYLLTMEGIRRQLIIWIANIVMLGLAFFMINVRKESIHSYGLRVLNLSFIRIIGLIFLILLTAAAGFILGGVLYNIITSGSPPLNSEQYDFFKGDIFMFVITLLGVFVVSSFGEEFIYRAFLINKLQQILQGSKWSKWGSIFGSAVIFGGIHFTWGAIGVFQTFVMGIVLAWWYLKLDKNLWILVIVHAILDFLLLFQLFLQHP